MKKIELKLIGIIITLGIIALIIPTKVLGANAEVQTVLTENGDYIIYVKDMAKTEFDFAISNKADASEEDLDYIKSVTDKEGNQVVLITKEKYESMEECYLYIKTSEEKICEGQKINFEEAFDQQKMEEVETTTTRIQTEVITDIIEKDEEVEGVKIKVTVGGLKIADSDVATSKYYYTSTKLPAADYSELMSLAEKINAEYNDMDMYTRIETAKQFYEKYDELKAKQDWLEIEDMTIMQPDDAQKGDQYVVYLKKVDEDGSETVDVKLMTSYREDEEEKIPGRTETKVVKETAKLPITGDNIVLIVILVAIILVAIIVFIRMKNLSKKESKN